MAPQRDETSGRLRRGELQLPDGTLLLLDETTLAGGQLADGGVRALQALATLAAQQVLRLESPYYSQDFPRCVPVVALSIGRSVLRESLAALTLPLAPAAPGGGAAPGDAADAVRASAAGADMDAVRDFLLAAAATDLAIPEDVSGALASEFARRRAADAGFDAEAFGTHLTLARMVALSRGEAALSLAAWGRACELEAARRARLAA
jgi:hypothetical protein